VHFISIKPVLSDRLVSNKHGIEAKRKQHISKVSNKHENEAITRIQKNEIASKA
jgi:hypothetical protein